MSERTLADMTPAERQECVGMWCDNLVSTADTPTPVVLACVQGDRCWVLHTTLHGEWSCFPLDAVAPRPALPRAWTPGGAPAPAGVLAPDGYRTAYGVWSVSPNGSEDYDWIRDESRDTATTMVRNLRAAGWEAEVIARHVSEPRFVTRTAAAHAQKEETNE